MNYIFITTFIVLSLLNGCGRAYFPIELKTISREKRTEVQDQHLVKLVPMTKKNVRIANKKPYERRVIIAGDLTMPAKVVKEDSALIESIPQYQDPGPYKIGAGDVITLGQRLSKTLENTDQYLSREIVVSDDGSIKLMGQGKIRVEGLTQAELEDAVYRQALESGYADSFEIIISEFNSKKIYIISKDQDTNSTTIPYTNQPIFLKDILISTWSKKKSLIAPINLKTSPGEDSKIILKRDKRVYVLSYLKIMRSGYPKIRLFPDDQIFVERLIYKKERVLLVGETGAQSALGIASLTRPTLSDVLFSSNSLNKVTSDFSQIYVIRGESDKFKAYHLDITDPSRISIANIFEMRPDDIVFVATQPLSLYSRTLSQILGSTGLTLQARDTIRTEIGK